MAITATTISGAVGLSDTSIPVAATTGITGPTTPTGAGYTWLKVDAEMMFVSAAPTGLFVPVIRGQLGTQSTIHGASTPVFAGTPSDFPNYPPLVTSFITNSALYSGIGAPLTGAVITPTGSGVHHFTGTTALTTIIPPAGLLAGGTVTLVFDGSASGLTWTAAGGANTISVAGSVTAKQSVDFFYDPTTTLWTPSTIT